MLTRREFLKFLTAALPVLAVGGLLAELAPVVENDAAQTVNAIEGEVAVLEEAVTGFNPTFSSLADQTAWMSYDGGVHWEEVTVTGMEGTPDGIVQHFGDSLKVEQPFR